MEMLGGKINVLGLGVPVWALVVVLLAVIYFAFLKR